jgi:hypothetical protein
MMTTSPCRGIIAFYASALQGAIPRPIMPTKRKPIIHPPVLQITPRAVEAFKEWAKLSEDCDCDDRGCPICQERSDLHEIINTEFKLKPWQWCWQYNNDIIAMLEQAAAENRWGKGKSKPTNRHAD